MFSVFLFNGIKNTLLAVGLQGNYMRVRRDAVCVLTNGLICKEIRKPLNPYSFESNDAMAHYLEKNKLLILLTNLDMKHGGYQWAGEPGI